MADKDVLVIAHRGASGYLPEHTLEAKALAYGMGANYLEQDVIASRDNELVVLHDIHLDRVTNVAEKFPDRKRDDGRYYVRDFDVAELKTLRVWERRDEDGLTAVFPNRFPTGQGAFQIPTLREEIKLVQGLNRSTGRSVGIYVEIKRPAWHLSEGVDLSPILLQLLDDFGYRSRDDLAFVQCFDAAEVRRIRRDLGCELKLVQLLGENDWGESDTDYEQLKTPDI
jgi:glycerophosphoryl diester phosphodiesterase